MSAKRSPINRKRRIALETIIVLVVVATGRAEDVVQRIAFGSCARQNKPQPIWNAIVAQRPDLFIFLGDSIYADTQDMGVLRAEYAKLSAIAGYQQLRATCPVLATWDDHDYGANDAGREFPAKMQSQEAFLDFFQEPADSPRRATPGVYDAKVLGPVGKRVQIIVLDTRYFRTELQGGYQPRPGDGRPGRYFPNDDPAGTILGEAQWQWLESRLRTPAELRILCSSIQAVANEHHFEKWGNIPHERERLFKLLRDTEAGGLIIISGDRHFAELSRLDDRVGFPLYEVTSSALNQRAPFPDEINPHRVGSAYRKPNFGMITIDWGESDPEITLDIRTEKGDIAVRERLSLSTIQPPQQGP